ISGYGRQAELQSDELSIKYLAKAGYDVEATKSILQTLKRLDDLDSKIKEDTTGKRPEKYHGAFASHPETKKRIEEAVLKSEQTSTTGLGEIGHEVLIAKLENYPYDESAEQGAMVGRRFIHPELDIQLTFPEQWVVTNTPTALTAVKRQKKAYFRLVPKDLVKRQNGEELLRDMAGSRAEFSNLKTSTRDGYEVTQAEIKTSLKNVGAASLLATVFMRGPKAFLITSWSKRKEFDQFRDDFKAIAASFHSYDPKIDGDVPRIALYTWHEGDKWSKLAANNKNILGPFTADKLAVLNGMGPEQSPANGSIIKIVK
ncbi:MAG: M48 family metalloprotease, partial [Mariprofundaceae bacterium]|nr:M48 family metalloprotease [Mariprofundaceae bacterium]